MDKSILACGCFLLLAGLVGVIYGAGINYPGMVARQATDYSGITAYVIEWLLIVLAGLLLIARASRQKK